MDYVSYRYQQLYMYVVHMDTLYNPGKGRKPSYILPTVYWNINPSTVPRANLPVRTASF